MGDSTENLSINVEEENSSLNKDSGNINDVEESLLDENQPSTKNNEDELDPNEKERGNGLLRLPIARIKKIMKADPSLGIASQDSVFLIAKATELFIESLVVESYQNMATSKKKTLSRRDFDSCVESIDSLAFLDGAIDE